MPDFGDMLRVIVPLVVIASWIMSFLYNKEAARQAQQAPRPPGPEGAPAGQVMILRRPDGTEEMIVLGDPSTTAPVARAQRPRPPRASKDKETKAKARPPERPKPLGGGIEQTMTLATNTMNVVPAPSAARGPAPSVALAVLMRSPERLREAFLMAEVLGPPVSLRGRKARGAPRSA